jgi:hypothetical protein
VWDTELPAAFRRSIHVGRSRPGCPLLSCPWRSVGFVSRETSNRDRAAIRDGGVFDSDNAFTTRWD